MKVYIFNGDWTGIVVAGSPEEALEKAKSGEYLHSSGMPHQDMRPGSARNPKKYEYGSLGG